MGVTNNCIKEKNKLNLFFKTPNNMSALTTTAKDCPKIRIGKKVKIISSLKKSFIGKDGKIIERKYDDFFPDTFVYLIAVPGKDSYIWQYGSELEVL